MSSEAGGTEGILNLVPTTKSLIKPATLTPPKTPDGPTFDALSTPSVTPRTPVAPITPVTSFTPSSPCSPRKSPSPTVTPNRQLPETTASASAPGNIAPVCPQPEDSLARQTSRSSVAKAKGPHGSTSTGEIKKNRPTVARRKVSKATKDRVSTVIKEINQVRSSKTGDDDGEFRKWTLNPDEYGHLIDRVERNGGRTLRDSSNKPLRYEYSTSWNEFSIRMSSDPLHAIFWNHLEGLIKEKLANLPDGVYSSKLRDAAAKVQGQGDAAVEFDGADDRNGPDCSFYFRGCASENEEDQPPFVIEVNWSNLSSKKLAEKAKQYIQLSDGQVHTVVNIDLNQIYQKSKKGKLLKKDQKGPAPAFVSVWRSGDREEGKVQQGKDQQGKDQQAATPRKDFEKAFRNLDGKPNRNCQLVLFLSDFMCRDCANAHPGCTDAMIEITAEELCAIYTEGVRRQVNRLERRSKQAGRAQPRPSKLQTVKEVFSRSGRLIKEPDRLGFSH